MTAPPLAPVPYPPASAPSPPGGSLLRVPGQQRRRHHERPGGWGGGVMGGAWSPCQDMGTWGHGDMGPRGHQVELTSASPSHA